MRLRHLDWDGADSRALAADLRSRAPDLGEVSEAVAETIEAVRMRGDGAVLELTARFDATEELPRGPAVDPADARAALEEIAPELRSAMELVRENVERVSRAQLAEPAAVALPQGHTVRVEERALASAGIYAPGGRAAYPSSVLMGCVPARVAGVARVVLATPPRPDGRLDPLVLAAAALAEVDEIFAMGGAQAIAALALGTQTVEPVDLVAGPGNRYVTESKRQLVGKVGIDGLAGPSELMVVLGDSADLGWVALDLCAQAEHGSDGLLLAVAVESSLLDRLAEELDRLAAVEPSVTDAEVALVAAPGTEHAVELANALAPEHLQLACDDAELLARQVRTAGCVFCGELGATAFGDYVAGSNHVLPTGGAGRFSGPLGPTTFRRRISVVSLPRPAVEQLAPPLGTLARAEGFPVHASSAEARASR